MKILALETSAKSVSAAVTDGGVVRAYTYQNTGLTHSRTLMPLVDAMLRESEQSLADMDLLAVAAGPAVIGRFIRAVAIGIQSPVSGSRRICGAAYGTSLPSASRCGAKR